METADRLRTCLHCFSVCLVSSLKVIITKLTFYRDGRSRCGIYCAANACIEQVIQHGEVDIFQAVRTVRRHRPQLIENIVSRIFLCLMLLHY